MRLCARPGQGERWVRVRLRLRLRLGVRVRFRARVWTPFMLLVKTGVSKCVSEKVGSEAVSN